MEKTATGPWLQRYLIPARRSMPFNQDHVCPGCAVPYFARFSVLFAVEPFLGAVRGFEFKHHDALRLPIAFQRFRFSAADDVLAAVFFHGRTSELFVFLVPNGIENFDFNDDIGGHGVSERLKVEALSPHPPLWLLSFAASSGIFFRRRSRSQLFHVLRMLSRGVWYF